MTGGEDPTAPTAAAAEKPEGEEEEERSTIVGRAVWTAEDRSMLVRPGQVPKAGWVDVWQCRFDCMDPLSVEDVRAKARRLLQLPDDAQPWPPPRGYWDGEDVFVIRDGRHQYLATVARGYRQILVAWLEPVAAAEEEGGGDRT